MIMNTTTKVLNVYKWGFIQKDSCTNVHRFNISEQSFFGVKGIE